MVDWNVIRQEDEQGKGTLRSLATKYDISKTTLIRKRNSEGWTADRTNGPRTGPPTPLSGPLHLPIPDDAATIARIGLHQLAQHLQTDEILPISSHQALSDALAQYVKVLIVAPREIEAQDVLSVPLNKISPRTRIAIQQLLDEDERLAQEQEQVS